LIETLGQIARPELADELLKLLRDPNARGVQPAVIAALQRYPSDEIAKAVVAEFPKMLPPAKARALTLLTSRKNSAALLMAAVDAGKIPPKELPVSTLSDVARLGDSQLDAVIAKHFGKVGRPSSGEVQARVHGIAVSLGMAKGDAARGKPLFEKNCGICHTLFGQGAKIGPDLTTADRKDSRGILAHIVDPSAVIRKEFLAYNVVSHDGQVLTGLLADSTPSAVTILDAKNQKTTISREAIESLEPSPTSLMPERILDQLDVEQIRDLFRYLQGDGAGK
jgi:putative heme-binding domain-containing protein